MQNKKLKILRIVTRLNIGGPAIHTTLLTREFSGDKFESRLLCGSVSRREGDMGYIAQTYGISPVYIPALRREINPFCDFVAFFQILKYMVKFKPHIVHTHTAKAGTLGRLAAILTGVPVKIHTFHGHVFYKYFSKRKTKLFIFVERILAKFTDTIIAISDKQKDEIINKYKITRREKCHVVKLGFDLQKFLGIEHKRNIFREKFKFSENDILVGIIGRLAPIKNHKMFIDALSHLYRNGKRDITERIKSVIVGDGEMREELSAYARFNGLKEKLLFTGWLKDIDEVYAGLDIVALTSLNEGTPVALIEAMSSFKPVISTDVGGVKDAVGNAGFLVASNDYKAMGNEILNLAESTEIREKQGKIGRDFVKEAFSKERLVAELEALYSELMSKKSLPAGRQGEKT